MLDLQSDVWKVPAGTSQVRDVPGMRHAQYLRKGARSLQRPPRLQGMRGGLDRYGSSQARQMQLLWIHLRLPVRQFQIAPPRSWRYAVREEHASKRGMARISSQGARLRQGQINILPGISNPRLYL